MKLKYYMRGVGTGILFTLFIFVVIIIPNIRLEEKIKNTDAEKRTEADGTVSNLVGHEENADAGTEAKDDTASDISGKPANETSPVPTEETAPVMENEEEPSVTPEEEPTKAPTATPTSEPTKKPTPTPAVEVDETSGKVKFTIARGMTSEKISKALEDYGVVDSWTALNSYISKNGYAAKIQVGTFTFTKNMSYRDVCKVICGKNFK